MHEILGVEREHLIRDWTTRFEGGRNPFDPHAPGSTHLHELLKGVPTPMRLRHFHNRLGWCAAYKQNCAGAVYRTEAFMRVPPGERRGTRLKQNIHIEHTMQATYFCHRIWLPHRPQDCAEALTYLMKYTPTTAMTYIEKGILARAERGNHGNTAIETDQPFVRYYARGISPVWNVFTGEQINLATYSFDDHLNTLRDLVAEVSDCSNLF